MYLYMVLGSKWPPMLEHDECDDVAALLFGTCRVPNFGIFGIWKVMKFGLGSVALDGAAWMAACLNRASICALERLEGVYRLRCVHR